MSFTSGSVKSQGQGERLSPHLPHPSLGDGVFSPPCLVLSPKSFVTLWKNQVCLPVKSTVVSRSASMSQPATYLQEACFASLSPRRQVVNRLPPPSSGKWKVHQAEMLQANDVDTEQGE